MKSVMKNAALFIMCSILVGLGWWLEFGWVAGVTVGGTMAAGVLGVGIWSIYKARHHGRS
jgi:hypothetical protein